MTSIEAVIISIVEGITEFLPISSTAHMVFTSSAMGIEKDAFTKLFEESIQVGAIFSVVLLYWRRFFDFKKINFYFKLVVAVIPAAIIGVLFKKHIEELLGNPMFIAIIIFLGGILLVFIDKFFKKSEIDDLENVSYKKSFTIGVFQILAIILPGFSRSAATIIGGLQQKLTRKLAAEFSFFLAVPTLAGAFVKSIWDAYKHDHEIISLHLNTQELLLTKHNIQMIAMGNFIAFIVAIIAIKFFISILIKYGFKFFGYYRIILGLTIIILLSMGINLRII